MRKFIIIAFFVLVATGCGEEGRNPHPTDADNGQWTTIITPDGRTCDIYSWSEDAGYEGYGFAGMDCEDR